MIKKIILSTLLIGILQSCSEQKKETEIKAEESIENPTNEVLLSSEIRWEKLNPARGNQSPQAGTIWGDRKGEIATGFLAKFSDGFSSPPHIHNVTYRAVVLKGLIHNNDADAKNMWMPTGSFWTQPKGEAHITSSKGPENIAYVEIDSGPYLVKPVQEAFNSGQRPINIDASNVVWLNKDKTNWIDTNCNAEISFLWESKDFHGLFIKLSSGFDGNILSDGKILHAIVIDGELNYKLPQTNETKVLDAGSSFKASSKAVHKVINRNEGETLLYVRTNGKINVSEKKL